MAYVKSYVCQLALKFTERTQISFAKSIRCEDGYYAGPVGSLPGESPRAIMSYVQQAACRTARAQGERCADSDWSCIYGQPSSGLLSRPFADERQAATLVDELEAPKLD